MNRFITLLLLGVVAVAMLLVFSVHMNGTDGDAPDPARTVETAPAEAPLPAAPAPDPAGASVPPQPEAAPPAELAEPAEPAPASPPQTPAAPAAQTPARPAPSAPEAPPAQAPATASRPEGSGNIKDVSLHFKDQGMLLRIEGDGPLPARYFILSQPERLVVDLPGSWKGFERPAVPGNNLVKSVRTGRQGNADRLVLDLAAPVKKHELTRLSDSKVEIYFAQ